MHKSVDKDNGVVLGQHEIAHVKRFRRGVDVDGSRPFPVVIHEPGIGEPHDADAEKHAYQQIYQQSGAVDRIPG